MAQDSSGDMEERNLRISKVCRIGAIKSNHINRSFAFGGIDDLTNAPQRRAARDGPEKVRQFWVRRRGIDFFIGVREFRRHSRAPAWQTRNDSPSPAETNSPISSADR